MDVSIDKVDVDVSMHLTLLTYFTLIVHVTCSTVTGVAYVSLDEIYSLVITYNHRSTVIISSSLPLE